MFVKKLSLRHLLVAAAFSLTLSFASPSGAAEPTPVPAKNIVLVHGAFADASGWHKVITRLTKLGYHVTAVQNPLTSIADDVATTKRVIAAQDGPTVVVAHSYGGIVASQAAVGEKNVTSIVYLAAFVPEDGEATSDLLKMGPDTPLTKTIRADSAGFAYIDRKEFRSVFCADLSADDSLVLAATQKPAHFSTFGTKSGAVAWKNVPTFYQVSDDDQCISPVLEATMAKRINATTIHLKSSHVAFLSHPKEVVALIERAAK